MIYVVVAELIPELHEHEYSDLGTLFFSLGFVIMMILDVALPPKAVICPTGHFTVQYV